MRKYLIFLLLYSSASIAQNINNDFQAFRKDMLTDYREFRHTVLDDYSKFLNGVWDKYKEFRGVKRDNTPKPTIAPTAEGDSTSSQILPTPDIMPHDEPEIQKGKPEQPIPFITTPSSQTLVLSFYGTKLKVISCKVTEVNSLDHKEIASAWVKYHKDKNIKIAINSLKTLSSAYGLNDWFLFELIRIYANKLTDNTASKIILRHYLLTNMGYDVRLASTNSQLLLLVPFKQQVYERNYLQIDGQNYYSFYDDDSIESRQNQEIYTCSIPRDSIIGRCLDLTLSGKQLLLKSGNRHTVSHTDGTIKITSTVDVGTMESMRHYPLMDIPYYAMSCISSIFHKDLLMQMKEQIKGLPEKDAASQILHFIQYAFEYATDDEQHGYEKPYFIEENFYYPKNDCEDRAILFAFFVHNLLDLDVHLVQYPGHECTAIKFSSPLPSGDGYIYNGQQFYICDPTYIGASIGQCIPSYKDIKPKIEEWY